MPANVTIYLPESKPDIKAIFPGAGSDKKLFSAATFYQLTLPGAEVRLNVYPMDMLQEHLHGFLGYLQTLDGDNEKKRVAAIQIQETKCVLGVVTDKELGEAPAIWQAVLKIAQKYNGFLFHANSIVQADGTPLIGPAYDALQLRKEAIQHLEENPGEESIERRDRSFQLLKAKGIPFITHLPVLPGTNSIQARTTREVAERALAVLLVCAKSDRLNPEELENIRKKYGADKFLTGKEREFIENEQPQPQEFLQWSWRYESLWVLCWALQFVDNLKEPSAMCDVGQLLQPILARSGDQFLADAKLRTLGELLDSNDLIYRYHWAIRNANLKSEPLPENLNADVVMEWHHALNWLTRHFDEDWDDVTTDT